MYIMPNVWAVLLVNHSMYSSNIKLVNYWTGTLEIHVLCWWFQILFPGVHVVQLPEAFTIS